MANEVMAIRNEAVIHFCIDMTARDDSKKGLLRDRPGKSSEARQLFEE